MAAQRRRGPDRLSVEEGQDVGEVVRSIGAAGERDLESERGAGTGMLNAFVYTMLVAVPGQRLPLNACL